MTVPEKDKDQLHEALAVIEDSKTKAEVTVIAEELFSRIYDDLNKAIVGNPIEHHPIALAHMLKIATRIKSPYLVLAEAAALALLHDISAVPKITKQMVTAAGPGKGDALELERQENRILHMREGSAVAHRYLLALNKSLGRIVFDSKAIDRVCEAIRIHDNPSLDIPIHRSNWLAVAFREADRLWMITHLGILADLARKCSAVKDADEIAFPEQFCTAYAALIRDNENTIAQPDKYRDQLEDNIKRFCEERELYRPLEPTEGPFCDESTFFRTAEGHAIYRSLCDTAYGRLGTPADQRLV